MGIPFGPKDDHVSSAYLFDRPRRDESHEGMHIREKTKKMPGPL